VSKKEKLANELESIKLDKDNPRWIYMKIAEAIEYLRKK
jgi:type III secretion system FlhB-like substrate exporter